MLFCATLLVLFSREYMLVKRDVNAIILEKVSYGEILNFWVECA
jgi:hypothetical protein